MNKYRITSKTTSDVYQIWANDFEEARHWVINHLDTSHTWDIWKKPNARQLAATKNMLRSL